MFGNSLRMLCLFSLTCLLLPHQILSKSLTPQEWAEQETAKGGHDELVKELEFSAAFKQMLEALSNYVDNWIGKPKWGDASISRENVILELQKEVRQDVKLLRKMASKLNVHDSPLVTVQQFQEIAPEIINRLSPDPEQKYQLM